MIRVLGVHSVLTDGFGEHVEISVSEVVGNIARSGIVGPDLLSGELTKLEKCLLEARQLASDEVPALGVIEFGNPDEDGEIGQREDQKAENEFSAHSATERGQLDAGGQPAAGRAESAE